MAFEMRDNSGALFRNDKATGNQPEYRGDCKIDGVEYKISAWVKVARNGSKFFSFAFQRADEVPQRQGSLPERNSEETPF